MDRFGETTQKSKNTKMKEKPVWPGLVTGVGSWLPRCWGQGLGCPRGQASGQAESFPFFRPGHHLVDIEILCRFQFTRLRRYLGRHIKRGGPATLKPQPPSQRHLQRCDATEDLN